MGLGPLLREFATKETTQIVLLVLIADFFLGVCAAVKQDTFHFAYVSDFLKTDILGKVVPYFILSSLALVAGHVNILIPGLDFGVLAGFAYAALMVALVGSILSSMKHLGVPLPDAFAGEKPPPGP